MEVSAGTSTTIRDSASLALHEGSTGATSLIKNPHDCALLYKELSTHVTTEALLLMSNSKAILRESELGIIRNLIDAAMKRDVRVHILCPIDATNASVVNQIRKTTPLIRIVDSTEMSLNSTFLTIDSAEFARFEITNLDANNFESAVGVAVYSKSKATVDTFRALFNLIWDKTIQAEEFKTRERMKDQFIAVASHELRTPIQPILGYALLARKGILSQDAAWDKVLREARRLQRLANDILDVSKIDSGNYTYNMGHEKINRLLSSIVDSMQSEVQEGLTMRFDFDNKQNDLEIEIDRTKITQAVTNLIGNAIKFTQTGSILVQSELFADLNKLEIRVIDAGPGIAKEIQPVLFDKFATRGHGDVQNNKGTGLGLYITKSIILGHGGQITASNNINGMGATFTITLPLVQPKKNNPPIDENIKLYSSYGK